MMSRDKPMFMKTYGKQRRRIDAWISPDNRKEAFDSTANSSIDVFIYDQAKHTKTRPKESSVSCRAGRHAKRKAMQCLTAYSDEENISPHLPSAQPTQQSNKAARKNKKFSQGLRQKPNTSESEADTSAPKRRKTMTGKKKPPNVSIPSVGRFVTRRRGALSSKPKLRKGRVTALDSSDDFVHGSARQPRPRVPSVLKISKSENSLNDTGSSVSSVNPLLREISLNDCADQSLGPCHRKPLFCSTPSLQHPFAKRPRIIPRKQQPSATQSTSVSHIGWSTSQEEPDTPEEPFSPPHLSSPGELSVEGKPASSSGQSVKEQELSDSLVLKRQSRTGKPPCGEKVQSQNNTSEIQNGSLIPILQTVSSDHNSASKINEEIDASCFFVSATTESQGLVEILKEKCLSQHCTVQLERVDKLVLSRLHGQTLFSTCLDLSSLVYSQHTTNHLESVKESCSLGVSKTSNATTDQSQLIKSSPPLTHKETLAPSRPAEWIQPSDHHTSKELPKKMQSVSIEVTHRKKKSTECMSETETPNNSCSVDPERSTNPSEEERRAAVTVRLKEACLAKKWTVQLKPMSISQLIGAQCSRSGLASEADTVCPGKSDHPLPTDSPDRGQEGVDAKPCIDRERTPSAKLKEECLAKKFTAAIKLMTPPRPCSHGTEASSLDALGQSDPSAGNNKSGSNDLQGKDSQNPQGPPPKRKKASLAPKGKKRRSVSRDRPGTTRKACVSGLSVSRWQDKGRTSTHVAQSSAAPRGGGGTKVVDCSVNELFSTHHRPPPMMDSLLQGTGVVFSTPVRTTLLADLSSNTHTWSRLKAALSVHRKTQAFLTPERFPSSAQGTPRWARCSNSSLDLFATPIRTPLPERLWSQLIRSDLKAVPKATCEDAGLSDAEKVWAECGQQRPLSWEEGIAPQRLKRCVKIGEGTFGEVFSTVNAAGDTVALKVIPVEGSEKVNGEDQKSFGEILHEIIISKELSSLKDKPRNQTYGFIGLNDLHCMQGCYPPALLKAWDTFDQQKGSENDRPDFFEKDQMFLVLEFEFGGSDLENSNGTLSSLVVAKSILHQVTAAMAVAEEELRFEHRDLHWGNVLVKPTKEKTGRFLHNGTSHSMETKGVLVRIIDYSLSRIEIDGLTVSCDISEDEELFMGKGDYQFDIYRLMREENGNNWNAYKPYSNVLWLHYLCSKLLLMKYRRTGGKGIKEVRQELACFMDQVLRYSSATEVLEHCFSVPPHACGKQSKSLKRSLQYADSSNQE